MAEKRKNTRSVIFVRGEGRNRLLVVDSKSEAALSQNTMDEYKLKAGDSVIIEGKYGQTISCSCNLNFELKDNEIGIKKALRKRLQVNTKDTVSLHKCASDSIGSEEGPLKLGDEDRIEMIDSNNETEYAVVKLNKIFRNNNESEGLEWVDGLLPIYPDTEIKSAIINKLLPAPNQDEGMMPISNCEVLIAVTMINEAPSKLQDTMDGIAESMAYFEDAKVSPEKIACIVIVDGIKEFKIIYDLNPEFHEYFDESVVKQAFNNINCITECKLQDERATDEFAHCFTMTRKYGNDPTPLNLIFCVKHFSKRKLNSHLWFFGGFCQLINPSYVVLLDAGTKPMPGSLFYLYEAMKSDPNIAGCCGEIRSMSPDINNWTVTAQVVEYKFSHILDKALESTIGFITVLPGAFSAYRWVALSKSTRSGSRLDNPLWKDYFKSICYPQRMSTAESNIYLAEDRVLCLSLFTLPGQAYTLRYVKKSIAETDVPINIHLLMMQRRRWINGSWFALIDSLNKWKLVYNSNHSKCRKIMFTLQMYYYLVVVAYTWIIVGASVIAVQIAISYLFKDGENDEYKKWFEDLISKLYVWILMLLVIVSLSVKASMIQNLYTGFAVILAIYQVLVFGAAIKYLVGSPMVFMIVSYILVPSGVAVILVLNRHSLSILIRSVHYVLMVPTYINIFTIYAICNVHDCTWGTKSDTLSPHEIEKLDIDQMFRSRYLLFWIFCNSLFSYLMNILIDTKDKNDDVGLYVFGCIGIGLLGFRLLGGVVYLFCECYKDRRRTKNCFKGGKPEKKIDDTASLSPEPDRNIKIITN